MTLTECSDIPCRPKLKENMDYCMSHPEEISKISSVQKRVGSHPNDIGHVDVIRRHRLIMCGFTSQSNKLRVCIPDIRCTVLLLPCSGCLAAQPIEFVVPRWMR
jgi:hypothetical protein